MMASATPPCDCQNCELVRLLQLPDDPKYCQRPSVVKREFTPFPKVHNHRGHAEQIGKYGSPNGKKYEKKRANRLRRRAEKRDPENVPIRMTKGWND